MGNSEDVKSVLALAPNWLGDTVMCTPALRALRRRYTEATLTVAANPACCDLLEDLPWIDGLFRLLPKSSSAAYAPGEATRPLCAGPDGRVPPFFRSALGLADPQQNRIGYARDGRAQLLTNALMPNMEEGRIVPVYMTREYLDLVQAVDAEDDGAGLELGLNPAMKARLEPVLAGEGPLVAIAPGAAFGPSKRWMPEGFAAVADALAERLGARLLLLTGPDEEETRAAVIGLAKSDFIDVPREAGGVGAMKALIARSDLLICNDSGPGTLPSLSADRWCASWAPRPRCTRTAPMKRAPSCDWILNVAPARSRCAPWSITGACAISRPNTFLMRPWRHCQIIRKPRHENRLCYYHVVRGGCQEMEVDALPETLAQGTGVSFISMGTRLRVSIIGNISVEEYESGKEELEMGLSPDGPTDDDAPLKPRNIERLF